VAADVAGGQRRQRHEARQEVAAAGAAFVHAADGDM